MDFFVSVSDVINFPFVTDSNYCAIFFVTMLFRNIILNRTHFKDGLPIRIIYSDFLN